jgi:CheY-like chemotaxis protein
MSTANFCAYTKLFDMVTVPALICDHRGVITRMNQRLAKLIESKPACLVGRSMVDVFPELGRAGKLTTTCNVDAGDESCLPDAQYLGVIFIRPQIYAQVMILPAECGSSDTLVLIKPDTSRPQSGVAEDPPGASAGRTRDTKAPTAEPPGGGETILVVDDEESIRELLAIQLSRIGYEVVTAKCAEEALARDNRYINAVITDIMMPGMNGVALAENLRKLYPELPIIFITGYLDENIQEHTKCTSRTVLLTKPLYFESIAQSLQYLLHWGTSPAVPAV